MSHQIQSRLRRFRAKWLRWRCPRWGGSKEPPSKPMRWVLPAKGRWAVVIFFVFVGGWVVGVNRCGVSFIA